MTDIKEAIEKKSIVGVDEFETRDIDKANQVISDLYRTCVKYDRTEKSAPFAMRILAADIGAAKLARVEVSNWSFSRNLEGLAHVVLPLKGPLRYRAATRSSADAPPFAAATGRPFEDVTLEVSRGSGLALYLPFEGLIERAERLTDSEFSDGLIANMVNAIDLRSPAGAALARNMKAAMAEMVRLGRDGMGALAVGSYEELLLNLATAALFPDVARGLERPARDLAPQTIRRARDYIREHASAPLELAKLAAELGVSMRSLQENFQKHFGRSPRDYLMKCRLERAREMLLTDRISSISDIAIASGFSDHSAFTAKYRAVYGEPPSRTVRLVRG